MTHTFPPFPITLTLCTLGSFECSLLSAFFFFSKLTFLINHFRKISSERQTVWKQIRPDIMSGLIWDQTVCEGYPQTTKVAARGKKVKKFKLIIFGVVGDDR